MSLFFGRNVIFYSRECRMRGENLVFGRSMVNLQIVCCVEGRGKMVYFGKIAEG
jgi:hypothetical protein